jgi:hypothetical protein
MDEFKEYRGYAEAAVRLAANSEDEHSKGVMLRIAQGWLELADLAAKRSNRTSSQGPDGALSPSLKG